MYEDSEEPKKDTYVRFYCATWNNYTDEDIQFLQYYGQEELDYLIYGKEVGKECKTPHLQIYMYKHNKIRFTTLKKDFPLVRFCASKRKNIGEAIYYCTKEDPDYVEIGTAPQQGKRNDLGRIYRRIKRGASQYEICDEYPEKYAQYWRGFKQMKKLVQKKKVVETTIILYTRDNMRHSFIYKDFMIKPYYFLKLEDDLWPLYHKKKFKYIFVDVSYGQYGTAKQMVEKLKFYDVKYIEIDAIFEEGIKEEVLQEERSDSQVTCESSEED